MSDEAAWPGMLPEHESGVRRLVAEGSGVPYRALRSLAEAQASPDGVVVLEGDDGGQVYVVCPAALVRCSEAALEQLLRDLDGRAWPHNPPDMARVFFERHAVGEPIWGGMGGGQATGDLWVHPEFASAGLEPAIRAVLGGQRPRL